MLRYRSIPFDPIVKSLVVVASEKGIVYIHPPKDGDEMEDWVRVEEGVSEILDIACYELTSYLRGKISSFTTPIDIERIVKTDFQLRVWEALQNIPYGQTLTYSEVAKLIDKPKAYRAVGNANAKNPICIIIPCHRVISKTGLGGYGGGIEMKRRLLDLEKKE